jgi:O-antigen ligase
MSLQSHPPAKALLRSAARSPAHGDHGRFPRKPNLYARYLLAGALLLIARGTIGARQRDDFMAVDSYAAAEAAIVVGMGILMACNPTALLMVWRRLSGTSGRPFIIFCIFSIATALWSLIPIYSAFRAGEFALQVFALLIAMAFGGTTIPRERVLIKCCVIVLVMELFQNFMLSGLNAKDNSIGASGAMLFCYGFGEFPGTAGKRRMWMILLCLTGLAGLVDGRSLASVWALAIIVFLTAIISRRHRPFALILGLIVLLTSILLITHSDVAQKIVLGGRSEEEVKSMTGRRMLWESYWDKFCEHPFFGYGYAVSSRTQGAFKTQNTHSSVLAVMMAGGSVGLAMALWPILLLLKEGIVLVKRQCLGGVGCFCALGVGLLNCTSISFLAETWIPPSFIFIMFYAFHLFIVAEPEAESYAQQRLRGFRRVLKPLQSQRIVRRGFQWKHHS